MLLKRFLQGLRADTRGAWRTIRKSPAFVAVAVASVALGVGANTAIFTLVDQLLLRSLPVQRPEQLVLVTSHGEEYGDGWGEGNELSYPIYEDLRDNNDVFEGMFCRFGIDLGVSSGDRSERVTSELVSGSYFPLLGVNAARGRIIDQSDDTAAGGASPVAVLSYSYWAGRFSADPAIIGKTLLVNNHPLTVIGIAQNGFHGTNLGKATELFLPIRLVPDLTPLKKGIVDRRTRWLNVFGRLRPGITPQQARSALQPYYTARLEFEVREPGFARASADIKARFVKNTIEVNPAREGRSDLRRQLSRPLWVLMAIVGFVLLIACANVANLLIARASARQREIAIRLAIGASGYRIVQQLLIESFFLALIGGGAGLIVAAWGSRALVGYFADPDHGLTISTSPDVRVLAFTIVVSVVTGILFGLAPAWQSASTDLRSVIQGETTSVLGGRGRLRRALVVSQIAISLVLLIGAGLFGRTLYNLVRADAGFDPAHILSFGVEPGENGYDPVRAKELVKAASERLQRIPGVAAVGIGSQALLEGGSWNSFMTIDGHPPEVEHGRLTMNNMITPGYFAALGIRMITGRNFDARDENMTPAATDSTLPFEPRRVAIVNEQFVKRLLGGEPALGRHVGFGSDPGTPTPIEIVGVVSDAKYTSIREEIEPQLFFPYLEGPNPRGFIAYLRTTGDPSSVARSARLVMHDLDPALPLHDVRTLEQQVDRSLVNERLLASLSVVFSSLATILAMVGLYGVTAYMVTRRTREIGVRMALGALARDMAWLVMRDVAWLVGAGIAV
ncbi:MAG TPA: ABC transporter permease, partial [Vicinamibacterales bacterium]|nr:ABC transporter permease [Vicinamibacterales bacterium]